MMQAQTIKENTLPTIVLNHLADSNDAFIDLSGLEAVMDSEELGNAKEVGVEARAVQLEGTLSSRIYQIAHEYIDGGLQSDFRAVVAEHPAYAKIYEEVKANFDAGDLLAVIERLEAIGCEVAYDRSTFQLSIGLSKNRLFKSFNEHSRVVDIRNRANICHLNGVNMFTAGKEPKHEMPALDSKIYYLVMKLKD